MSRKSDRPNPVSEEYEKLFAEVGRDTSDWTRQKTVARIGVEIAWELAETVQEFSHSMQESGREVGEAITDFSRSTQRLARVNLALTVVIAVGTIVLAYVAWVTRYSPG